MSQHLPHILPSIPPGVDETFATQQTTYEFYYEVQTRTEFQRHCQWYQTTAAQNRRDLEKMRGEFNIFQFFRRR
ncbi:MAG TPA: hypothetical protein VK203_07745 [Nostocaceae cyanobacterium]|nr:hypothetical protein [Nostocaceae cyanobacterium]